MNQVRRIAYVIFYLYSVLVALITPALITRAIWTINADVGGRWGDMAALALFSSAAAAMIALFLRETIETQEYEDV